MAANHGNPTGYWEPLDGLALNDAFLGRYGSNWYDPRLPPPIDATVSSPEGQAFIGQIQAFFENCAEAPLLLIKEPRINALTEFWFAAAQRLQFQCGVVVAVRHPAEVWGSLAARDGMPAALSNTLWFRYNWLAEQCSFGMPRAFVEYSRLLADWRREIDRVARALAIDLTMINGEAVDAFLSPALRHHDASTETTASDTQSESGIQRAYALLAKASRDEDFSRAELDRLTTAHMASQEATVAFDQFRRRFAPNRSDDLVDQASSSAI
ncbi:MAG TPA: hypothetical protein VH583_15505 [Vicinamibacterales bacterium]